MTAPVAFAPRTPAPPTAPREAAAPPRETLCNGLDDDNNGFIDDVDVAGDGVCDCLRVGTLGESGSAGVSNVFNSWLTARSSVPVANLGAAALTAAALGKLDVLIVQDVRNGGRAYDAAEVKALAEWVNAGGGVMTLTGYADPWSGENQNANRLLAPHGMSYGYDGILYKGGSTLPVTGFRTHPVTVGVTKVGIDNGYAVFGGGDLLAQEQGFDVFRGRAVGAGHVLVWGDEWITYDTEWKGHADYQVERLWQNIFRWLTKPSYCQVTIPATSTSPAVPPVK